MQEKGRVFFNKIYIIIFGLYHLSIIPSSKSNVGPKYMNSLW